MNSQPSTIGFRKFANRNSIGAARALSMQIAGAAPSFTLSVMEIIVWWFVRYEL
jgi:hypothetical protein